MSAAEAGERESESEEGSELWDLLAGRPRVSLPGICLPRLSMWMDDDAFSH